MTDEQLDELERLERAATPGPWETITEPESSCVIATAMPQIYGRHYGVAFVPHWEGETDNIKWEVKARNTLFIAAARNALPALIAEVRRLRAMVGEDASDIAPEDAPTLASLYGIAPNMTGGQDSVEYIRERRAEWDAAVAPEDAATEAALDAAGVLH